MANTYRTVNLSSGAGVDDKKIKVSIDDKQHEFIEQKLLAGSSKVSVTVQDPGLIEKLLVDIDETQVDHNNLLNYDVNEHRPLDDGSTSSTSLWSSQKTQDELDLKVTAVPSTDNAVVKFDGISGQVQDSGVIIDDLNNITVPGNLEVQGTLTYIDTDVLEVTDANITINKNGTQSTANAQQSGLRVEMSDATDVILGYDSSLTSKMALGEIGSESEIITADHTQTLFNKTIDFDGTGSSLSSTNLQDAVIELDNEKANRDLGNLEANGSGRYTLYSDISFNKFDPQILQEVHIRSRDFEYGIYTNNMRIFTGSTQNANSGFFQAISGNIFGPEFGESGNTWYGSGQIVDGANSGNSGYAALSSGSVQSGTSGSVYIFSGVANNGGNRGGIELDAPVVNIISGDVNLRDGHLNMIDGSNSVSNHIINLADPVNDQDAATKIYVDSSIGSIPSSSIITTDGIQGGGSLESDLLITLAIQELDEHTGLDRQLDYMVAYDSSLDEHVRIKIEDVAKIGSSKGDLSEGNSSLLESQTGSIVSGLSFNSSDVRSFSALVSVRIDADSDVFEEFTIEGINKGSSWEISYDSTGDDSSVDFDIDNSGQVVYTSGSYTNFVSGNIAFRATTTSIL